jgi:hypothetical protein
MIDFEEELKHFRPSTDIDEVEQLIHSEDLTDMTDLMVQMFTMKKE